MKFKNKYIIATACGGGILVLFGALQRIMHHQNADLYLRTGFYAMMIAVAVFALKLLLKKDPNHFLNK